MIWLSGHVSAQVLRHGHVGVILTPMTAYRPNLAGICWAADNACFSQSQGFNLADYLAWLDSLAAYRATCCFATAPDVLCDAVATWERSAPVLPLIRAHGYPAALVAQNGLERQRIAWDAFDALFIGGDTRWKLSETAYALMAEAKAHGKWVHVGRVNSRRRLRAAESGGADSSDGTFLRYAPDINLGRVEKWLQQPTLWTATSIPAGAQSVA